MKHLDLDLQMRSAFIEISLFILCETFKANGIKNSNFLASFEETHASEACEL